MCFFKLKPDEDAIREITAVNRLKAWSNQNGAPIYRIDYMVGFGSVTVFVFYKTDAELKKHTDSGLVELAKQEIMRILEEVGYLKMYKAGWFNFDSDEGVKRKYDGNYMWKLHNGD